MINQQSSNISLLSFRSTHQEALALEVSILDALLRRNRCSHQRTKYFQRLSMAFRALQKYTVLDSYNELTTLQEEVTEKGKQYKKKRKLEQVFWDIQTTSKNNEKEEEISQLMTRLELLGTNIIQGFPECVSRLECAAQGLFAEMARGFFLPFCTVAVGAVARIRSLLLRLGRHALQNCLPTLQLEWKSLLPDSESALNQGGLNLWGQDTDAFEQARAILTALSDPVDFSSRSKAERTQAMLLSLGLSVPKTRNGGEVSAPSEKDETALEAEIPAVREEQSAKISDVMVDVGESVHGEELLDDAFLNRPSNSIDDLGFTSSRAGDVDRNSEVVHTLKAGKKSKQPKRASSDSTAKKKKKQKKKGDFFDDLFA
jgi:hypothetical protein